MFIDSPGWVGMMVLFELTCDAPLFCFSGPVLLQNGHKHWTASCCSVVWGSHSDSRILEPCGSYNTEKIGEQKIRDWVVSSVWNDAAWQNFETSCGFTILQQHLHLNVFHLISGSTQSPKGCGCVARVRFCWFLRFYSLSYDCTILPVLVRYQ